MDPWTDATPSAIAVVIAAVPFPARRIDGGEGWVVLKTFGNETRGTGIDFGVVVDSPDVKDDGGVLREVVVIQTVVCGEL